MALGTGMTYAGETVTSQGISLVLEQLMKSDLYIAFFAAVFGFSFLIFNLKNISSPAKYSIHILVNYVASMICIYLLLAGGNSGGSAKGWIATILLMSVVYFILYGVAALVVYLVKRKK